MQSLRTKLSNRNQLYGFPPFAIENKLRFNANLESGKDLSAAVDVYADWIDACEGVANQAAGDAVTKAPSSTYRDLGAPSRGIAAPAAGAASEGNLEGFIDDDDANMEADYDDE